jgi:hypothetical protein
VEWVEEEPNAELDGTPVFIGVSRAGQGVSRAG